MNSAEAIRSHVKHMSGKSQHRVSKGKSYLTSLIAFYSRLTCWADVAAWVMDIVYLTSLRLSVQEKLMTCFSPLCGLCWLGVDFFSNCQPARSGVLQGSVLGPILYNLPKWSEWRDQVYSDEFCWWYQTKWGSGHFERENHFAGWLG